MFSRLSSAALIAIALVQAQSLPEQSAWALPDAATTYTSSATGRATGGQGATLTLSKSTTAPGGPSEPRFAGISATVPAEMLRGRRVTLRGELQTRGAGAASLWMRIDKSGAMLMLDNGQDRAVKGDSE